MYVEEKYLEQHYVSTNRQYRRILLTYSHALTMKLSRLENMTGFSVATTSLGYLL